MAFLCSFGAIIHHHGVKKRETVPHVYIANHTCFVDYIILSSYKFCHACVSENHGGLFGFLFRNILNSNGSISFKRSEKQDRNVVKRRLSEHINNVSLSPMLVFPEGTCVNNKYTVLFQKGIFELDVLFKPVAIKFRRNVMDPYWNRRKHSFTIHLLYLMTRWKLEADVWWIDDVYKKKNVIAKNDTKLASNVLDAAKENSMINDFVSDNKDNDTKDDNNKQDDANKENNKIHDESKENIYESATDLANRIKMMISEKGGLKNVYWNGYFKSQPVLRDREILREAYRQFYIQRDEYEANNKVGKITIENSIVNDSNKGKDNIKDKDNVKDIDNKDNTDNKDTNKYNNKNADRVGYRNKNEKSYTRNRNIKTYNNYTRSLNIKNVARNYERIYFERFTYENVIENVLQEYLKMKTGKIEFVATDDFWWGNNRRKGICKCKKEKKMYCHEGGCRSEYFMQKHN
ncbi:hypothetical protein BDAP_002500 [Binucleata daphniae]